MESLPYIFQLSLSVLGGTLVGTIRNTVHGVGTLYLLGLVPADEVGGQKPLLSSRLCTKDIVSFDARRRRASAENLTGIPRSAWRKQEEVVE